MDNYKLIGQGRTADILDYGNGSILKLYKRSLPAAKVEDEYQISAYVHALGVKTPQPFEILELDGRQGIVFQRVKGLTMLSLISSKPWLLNQMAKQLAELHYHLHQKSAPQMRNNQKSLLRHHISEAPLLNTVEKERILNHLEQLPDGTQLCHGDFHPDNVLLDKEAWVIDWMTGASGSPAGDAARTILLLSVGTLPPGTPKLVRAVISMMRKRLKQEYLKQYLRLSGLTYSDIEQWLLPLAAARLIEWVPEEEKGSLLKLIRKKQEQ